jgi:hypothetical protein
LDRLGQLGPGGHDSGQIGVRGGKGRHSAFPKNE